MSKLEQALIFQLKAVKLTFEIEYRFHETRRWRFDVAFPDDLIAIECEGTTFYGKNANGSMKLGRHQTAIGFERDCEKYNAAAELGWRVFRYTDKQIKSGIAWQQIERLVRK